VHAETSETEADNIDARLRGMIIHRALELLNRIPEGHLNRQQLPAQLAADFAQPADSNLVADCLQEAQQLLSQPSLNEIFAPPPGSQVYNELPVLYYRNEQAVYGLVDRVIKTEDTVTIVDYKSHRLAAGENVQAFAEQFRPQLQYYQQGLEKIWPQRQFRTAILFTGNACLAWL
ncbi:MAG TPA: hypothetical protein ENJ64_05315, partial [Thiotrichales bacterium]|nr:hypothetical protein [Thiotrichales bacterium]